MLTFEQIKELIDLVAAHRLSGMELERSGFRLRIDGYQAPEKSPSFPEARPAAAPVAHPAAATLPSDSAPAASSPPPPAPAPASDIHLLSSPIVGTFYRAPNPEAPPFAEVGSRVEKGQILCIIEAMKLMNEIESDVAGIVVEVFPKNGQPVEYGERLFAIKVD